MTPDTSTYPAEPTTASAGRTSLGEFATYAEAQTLVDRLSDDGFDVQSLRIVGSDLRLVEKVTGRMTTGRAALVGAASGAWWGLFVGLLLGLFSTSVLAPLLTGLLVGALFGAVFGALGHGALRGARDFSSVKAMEAGRYEVLVDAALAPDARARLAR